MTAQTAAWLARKRTRISAGKAAQNGAGCSGTAAACQRKPEGSANSSAGAGRLPPINKTSLLRP